MTWYRNEGEEVFHAQKTSRHVKYLCGKRFTLDVVEADEATAPRNACKECLAKRIQEVLRSGKFTVEQAPASAIDALGNLPYQLLDRVFGVKEALITDESSLWDFRDKSGKTKRDTKAAIVERINRKYRVNVSDITDGNLVAVCNAINTAALLRRVAVAVKRGSAKQSRSH